MTTSELIQKLAEYVSKHGDTLVLLRANSTKVWLQDISVTTEKDANGRPLAVIGRDLDAF